jgi:hypothetical protein
MARRKTRVAQREQRKKLGAILGVAAIVALILAGGGWFLLEKSKLQSTDENLCPPEPSEFTAVIVDVTDPLTLAQRQDLRNRLDQLRQELRLNGQIAFYKVDASNAKLLQPILKRCNPGTAGDFSHVDRDLKRVQATYDDKFEAPIVQAYEGIFSASGSDRSPIMQSIQSVNLTELQTAVAKGKPRQIVLISDLLQNTNNLSFYGRLPPAEEVLGNPDFRAASTNLAGVRVKLWMLQRPDYKQTQPRALPDLWNILLQEQGALSVKAERISG